jgi:hypothetical protein
MPVQSIVLRAALVTAAILSIPLIAMRFTDAVNWTLADFVVGGALLFGTGMAFQLVARRGRSTAYRGATGLAVAGSLLLVWMNLAASLIGSEDNPANLLYLAVLVVGLVGAGVARLRPAGMARTLHAMAFTQFLVPLLALAIWRPEVTDHLVWVFFANALFIVLFVGSALLFRQAGSTESGAA